MEVLQSSNRNVDRLTAAVFGGVLACGLAVLYWIGRIGFTNPVRPIVVTLGLALFIICVPTALATFIGRKGDNAERWWLAPPILGIASIALTALLGAIVYPTHINLGLPITIAGAAAFCAVLVLWLRRSRAISIVLIVAFLALFTAWVGGIAWGTRYKTPLFWEQISDRANVHHDPLYYVSMANSMRAYGVPSTGLDGVPYTPYHYGSAWLNSQWADLAGVDVLTFYSLGPTVLMAPVFFAGLLLLAGEARAAWRLKRRDDDISVQKPFQEDWPAWLVFVGVTIGFIPSTALDALGIWNRHLLISESYLTGLCVFILCASLAINWWFGRDQRTKGDAAFILLVAPLLLISLGFLKVSLMLLALAVVLWAILRTGLLRDRLFLAGSIVTLAASAVTFKLVSVAAQNQGIVPFSFMRYYADGRSWPYFIVGHLFWSWIYIAFRIREEKLPALSDLYGALRTGRLLDAELVAVVAICGFLPGELIDIHGGSAVYFSDVQRWIAAPLAMAVAARWIAGRKTASSRAGLGSMRLATVAAILIAIPVGLTIVFNVGRAVRGAVIQNVGLREQFYSYAGVSVEGPVRVRDPHVLAAGLQKAPDYGMISALRALDAEPRELKRKTLLFVPQSDSAFWHVFSEPERCSFAPLVGPATSGLALLDGMPPASCDRTDQYGLTAYARRTRPQTADDVTPASICAKAKAKGFRRVIVLEPAGDGRYVTPAIDC